MKHFPMLLLVYGVIVSLLHCATATDLFVRPQGCPFNVRLVVDDSYRELVNASVEQCAATCLSDGMSCRSFSYFDNPANATKTCSLNIGHSDQVATGLRYAQYWSYYERITETTGADNYGIADIQTCQTNTYRDCRTAYLATNNASDRQVWLKLDNMSYPVPGFCKGGNDILMMQRTGAGFYDISWNRPWEEYKHGFGRDFYNFWMGLDFMYQVINQDVIFRWSNNRCMFPRKLNGTTTRLALSDQLQSRCPYWSIRSDGKIVLSLRSLCICEDVYATGHVSLCGCNEPNRYQFVWSPLVSMIVSKRPNTGNRCLRINADAGGEEIAVADCVYGDSQETWTTLTARYRNFWASWEINNNYRTGAAVHTYMNGESANYQIRADPIYGCANLASKVQQWQGFSTYDADHDKETYYNLALREAGGDWWTQYGWSGGSDPKFTAQKDVSHFNFCGAWLMNAYMSLQADDFYY